MTRVEVMVSAFTLEHAPLKAVYIYFDTATYDEIERDQKVLFSASSFAIMSQMNGSKSPFLF